MDLYTRCPSCDTTFRVTTQQLQSSGGQVRCGHCNSVFDAFTTLTAQEPQGLSREISPIDDLRLERPDTGSSVAQQSPAAPSSSVATQEKPKVVRPDPAASLYEWEFRTPQAPRHRGTWAVLVIVLAIALAVQIGYAFRTEIMVFAPQTRSYYTSVCAALGCTVELPRLSYYLHIESSDLTAVDPAHPNEVRLLLSVRNRAPIGLSFPAFELTLTNSLEQAIARRVFLPSDYLPVAMRSGGLPAGTELPIQLHLDIGELRAAGYRLYLFYP